MDTQEGQDGRGIDRLGDVVGLINKLGGGWTEWKVDGLLDGLEQEGLDG